MAPSPQTSFRVYALPPLAKLGGRGKVEYGTGYAPYRTDLTPECKRSHIPVQRLPKICFYCLINPGDQVS